MQPTDADLSGRPDLAQAVALQFDQRIDGVNSWGSTSRSRCSSIQHCGMRTSAVAAPMSMFMRADLRSAHLQQAALSNKAALLEAQCRRQWISRKVHRISAADRDRRAARFTKLIRHIRRCPMPSWLNGASFVGARFKNTDLHAIIGEGTLFTDIRIVTCGGRRARSPTSITPCASRHPHQALAMPFLNSSGPIPAPDFAFPDTFATRRSDPSSFRSPASEHA